ncbi:hypothetical protein PJL18_04433 [Paenarthrobacter nicotinovorans]|nr:hypothetical protein [Paenarthrobacter nicotinovorans]
MHQVAHALEDRLCTEAAQLGSALSRRVQPHPAHHAQHPRIPRCNGQHAVRIGYGVVGLDQHRSPDTRGLQGLPRLFFAKATEERTVLRTEPRVGTFTAGDESVQRPQVQV